MALIAIRVKKTLELPAAQTGGGGTCLLFKVYFLYRFCCGSLIELLFDILLVFLHFLGISFRGCDFLSINNNPLYKA